MLCVVSIPPTRARRVQALSEVSADEFLVTDQLLAFEGLRIFLRWRDGSREVVRTQILILCVWRTSFNMDFEQN